MNIIQSAKSLYKEAMGDSVVREQKSVQSLAQALNLGEMYAFQMLTGGYNITPYQAIEFYKIVAPVFTAIELLADKMSMIQPHIWNKKIGNYEDEKSPQLLALLNNPNADITQKEFFKAVASFYLITGNNYTIATGNINKPPLELFVPSPENINITMNMSDPFPETYQLYNTSANVGIYRKDETPKLGLIYVNRDRGTERQLWHMKTFNPTCDRTQRAYGLSKLNPIYYEIKQYMESNISNLSTLTKGARLSGLLHSENKLSETQRAYFRQQLNDNYSSASNAGRIMLLDGGKMDYKEMSKSNKDMDFRNLRNDSKSQVYTTLGIPIPYFESKNMTMNNFKESRLALYEDGVLPLADCVYQEKTNFLMPRFGLDNNVHEIWYNPEEIPALEGKHAEIIERKRKNKRLSVDEERALDGYEPIGGALGNTIFQSTTEVPLGTQPQQTTTTKKKFYEILSSHKDKEGKRLYSDEYIEKVAEKHKLQEG